MLKRGGRVISVLALAACLAGVIPALPARAQGEERLSGGVSTGSEYKELFLFTGRPVVVVGQVKVTRSAARNGKAQVRVSYSLKNEAHQVTLTRNITLEGEEREALEGRQIITTLKSTGFTETVRAGQHRYILRQSQFSYSRLTDRAGGVNYFTNDWNGLKVYEFNSNRGTLTVQMWGRGIGYEHAWGSTETQHIDLLLTFEGQVEERGPGRQVATYPVKWSGSASLDLTYHRWRRLDYVANEPVPISFAGGYLETRGEEATLKYEVDLPQLDSLGRVVPGGRLRDRGSVGLKAAPAYTRLPVPVLRDLRGHWSYREVLRLASLGILAAGEYFGPELAVTRGDFCVALAKLLDLEPSPSAQPARGVALPRGTAAGGDQKVSSYLDVPEDSPYYRAVEALRQRGVLSGLGPYFRPQEAVTRAEAVALLVKSVGLDGMAPAVVKTPFQDDSAIPSGFKPAVWVAERLGLVGGTPGGYFWPQRKMTRGEAAALLNRTLAYLQEGLRRDYQALLQFR
jgi:hypothetical protein